MKLFDYSRTGEVIEIIVRDFSGGKIETFKFNIEDKKKGNLVMKILREKYGFRPESKHRDLDWLKK